MLLTGTYQTPSEISRLLLGALPRVITLSEDSWECPFLDLLSAETLKDDPGQELVLDRLLDLVLIAALRAWLAGPEAQAPAWYRAQSDDVVGAAIRLLQENPARPWTVASLAAAVGVSRAVLARRFTELVGAPPMTYLAAVAAGAGRRPAPRTVRDHLEGGPRSRLRHAVCAQCRVQAGPRGQPARVPAGGRRAVSRAGQPSGHHSRKIGAWDPRQ